MTSRGPMTECATYQPMIGSRPGELSAAEAGALEAHVAGCQACRRWAAELASTEWLVSEALQAAAARRDFAPFVDGVMARVEAARPVPLLARALRAMRLHPRLVIGGALAPLVAALALGLWLQAGGRNDLAAASQLEVSAEGGATTIVQSADGPLVLIDDDDEET
jgi:anti-sigma factor RsiW